MDGLKIFAMSPEEGARTTLHLASLEEWPRERRLFEVQSGASQPSGAE